MVLTTRAVNREYSWIMMPMIFSNLGWADESITIYRGMDLERVVDHVMSTTI